MHEKLTLKYRYWMTIIILTIITRGLPYNPSLVDWPLNFLSCSPSRQISLRDMHYTLLNVLSVFHVQHTCTHTHTHTLCCKIAGILEYFLHTFPCPTNLPNRLKLVQDCMEN